MVSVPVGVDTDPDKYKLYIMDPDPTITNNPIQILENTGSGCNLINLILNAFNVEENTLL